MSDRNEFKWLDGRVTERPAKGGKRQSRNSHIVQTELWGFMSAGDPSGFWVGKAAQGMVGGWARGASHVDTRENAFVQFDAPEIALERCLLTLPLTGISALATKFDLSDKTVAVVGAGALSVLTCMALDISGVECRTGWSHAEHADFVVDTGVALNELAANGWRARCDANYIKIVEPDSARVDIDLYPNIHKRSLRLFCLPLFVPEAATASLCGDTLYASFAKIFADAPSNDGSKWITYRRTL